MYAGVILSTVRKYIMILAIRHSLLERYMIEVQAKINLRKRYYRPPQAEPRLRRKSTLRLYPNIVTEHHRKTGLDVFQVSL